MILIWLLNDKYQDYVKNYQDVTEAAIKHTADAISDALVTKRRILDHFVKEHRYEIIKLMNDPDNDDHLINLRASLKQIFPDVFAINIANIDGELMMADFDGFTGDMCVDDLKEFANSNVHLKRTHPNSVEYHFDEISAFKYKDSNFLFFTSFSLDQIVSILRRSTPKGHNLALIRENENMSLIEITEAGGRNKIKNRTDFRLTESELNSIIAKIPIQGTRWTIVSFENKETLVEKISLLVISALITLVAIILVISYMRKKLNKSFKVITATSERLKASNKKIIELNDKLERLSFTDDLTGIYNRRYFDKQFDREWRSAVRGKKAISVFMIDIDHFKKYNDTYGHIEGDSCLRSVAQLINSCFSRSNEYVARYGGEEFIAVTDCDKDSCINVSKAIHNKLEHAAIEHSSSGSGQLTVSIGVAMLIPDKNIRPITLIEKADIALYHAKKKGRNQTVFYDKPIIQSLDF